MNHTRSHTISSHRQDGPMKRKAFFRHRLQSIGLVGLVLAVACTSKIALADPSVAREWDDQLLHAISLDTARPTVHARNLFHLSTAMYDAWAAYDTTAATY